MKRRKTKQKTSLAVLFFGIVFSFATLAVLSFISSFILSNTQNPLISIKLTSLVTLLCTAAISGFAIAKYKGDLNFGISITAAVSVAALILAISLISSKGSASGGVFMNCICYALISVFFSFIGRKRKAHRHR